MPLTLRYSLQDSIIKPSDVTGDYARLQVDSRPELKKITLSNEDYRIIVEALAEGRLIGLQNEDGIKMGQFMISLSGGVIVEEFKSPSESDVKMSFKPTQSILKDIRALVSFEQLPTVKNNPSISGFIFTDNTGNTFANQMPISTNGLLRIKGTNFAKNKMEAIVTQSNNAVKVSLDTQVNSGVKYVDILISNMNIDKANGFTKGAGLLIVKRKDNPKRKDEYPFQIL